MVERRIKVTLEVAADGAVKVIDSVGDAAEGAAGQFDKLGKAASENEKAIRDAGMTLTAFGVAGSAALIASGKAAVDWESAWAGVTKTVDGSAQELAGLEDGLRSMARELPASHQEIAAVAEAAGQLGVATPAVESFTRTMIDLGETTNLTADEAATAIAQMTNVMQTAPEDVERLASALVALGNDGASTERQIIQMAQRMSGAAAIVGLTEAEVLALANATASMGIEVEAGGTAVSKVFIDMANAAANGGEELATFAEVAGMSANEFATAFQERPAEAFAAFIAGLDGIQQSGGNVFGVLDDLGLSEVRVSRALLGMASSGDLLTDSLELGARAWEENTALADEAAKRYETTAAQMQVARNNAVDAAISFGEVLLPALVAASEAGASFAGWLADLPPEAQAAAVGVGAIATASSLLLGGTLLVVPKLIEMHKTLKTIQTTAPLAAAAIRGVALAAAGLSALVILDQLNQATAEWASRNDDIEQFSDALMGLGDAAEFAETRVAWMTRSGIFGQEEMISGADAMDRFAESAAIAFGDELMDKLGRLQKGGSLEAFIKDAESLDTVLAQMVNSGNTEQAATLFDEFWSRVEGIKGVELDEVMQGFTQYEEAMKGASAATLEAADAFDAANFPGLRQELTDNELAKRRDAEASMVDAEANEALAQAYADLLGEMGAGSSSFVSLTGALSATQAKTQEWAQAQADATKTTKDSWEDFYDGHSIQLDEYLEELQSMVDAQANWQSNMTSLVGRVSDETLEELARLGPEAAPLVAALVDGTAEQLAEFEENFTAGGAAAGGAWAAGFEGQMAVAEAAGQKLGGAAMAKLLGELQTGESSAAQAVLDYNLKAELEVLADTDPAAAAVLEQVNAIEASTATFDTATDVGTASGQFTEMISTIDDTTATFTTDANTTPARRNVDGAVQYADDSTATMTVYASTGSIYDAVGSAMHWIAGLRPVLRVGMNDLPVATGGPIMLATGGPVRGPGGPTEDKVPAYNRHTGQGYALSNGEWIQPTASVNYYGAAVMAALQHRVIPKELLTGLHYNTGGGIDRYGTTRAIPAPQVHVTAPSLDGATISGRFDIGGIMVDLIDGRIHAHDDNKRYAERLGG